MKKLLAIEDDELVAELICYVATEAGFVARPTKPLAMKSFYRDFAPDIIVMDVMMPEMDGFEVLRFLGKQGCKAEVIIISSNNAYRKMAETLADGIGLNVRASIQKPLRMVNLRKTFEKVMSYLEMRDSLESEIPPALAENPKLQIDS